MEYRKLSDLKKLDNNPRTIKEDDLARLIQSIRDNPEYFEARPLILSDRTGELVILGGNQRFEASKFLKLDKVPTHLIKGLTEEREREIIIRDNVSNGQWDYDLLANEWDVSDLDSWGVNIPNFDIDIEPEVNEDDFEATPPEEPKTKLGDLYEIGEHRLLCGSSINENDINRLIGNTNISLVHTDPPYGMNAVSKSGVLSKNYSGDIMGDNNTDVAKDSFSLIYRMLNKSKHIWWGANYYSSCLPDSECWLVWDKNNGGSDQTDCELAWSNIRSVVRKFTQASEKANRVHPTQKPVNLVNWCIEKTKEEIVTIADFFGGSGVTMIAAHQKKIKSFLMELDPKYCDVIVKRMATLDPTLTIKLNGLDVTNDWINQ